MPRKASIPIRASSLANSLAWSSRSNARPYSKGNSAPSLVLDTLRKREETALEEQEAKYRQAGNEEVAKAFHMVRTELLREVVRSLFQRLC